jgi:hypothetical protein
VVQLRVLVLLVVGLLLEVLLALQVQLLVLVLQVGTLALLL